MQQLLSPLSPPLLLPDPASLPEAELPDLVGGESYEWAAIGDLDAFFKRIYRYVTCSGCMQQHTTNRSNTPQSFSAVPGALTIYGDFFRCSL